ncbi:MAG: ATP-binding protein [Eubacteriales bacterium]|nr:ATP-binding protein [Eubacteriales bacterium]
MQNIEVKAAEQGCPTRLFDTISSFSNQDGGGVIVFGLSESSGYKIGGVYNAQDLQKKVTEQCKQMEPVVRPLFTIADIDGMTIVSAEIPGVDINSRPVFYKGVGRLKGSYIRVGESDEQMSEYEIYSYEVYKKKIHDELRLLPENAFTDVNKDEITLFLAKLKIKKPNLSSLPDDKNLVLSGIYKDRKLTLTGLMLFGIYPQAVFPQYSITAVVVPGYHIGETGISDERFIDNRRIEGTIPQMLEGAMNFISRNMRDMTIIDNNGKRADRSEYPVKAVREIILNALIHRDYSVNTETSPIRIMMFKNRLEVENPGGLYGRITLDDLGKVGADTRNPFIASNLEIMIDTENRFSGIPTIRDEMQKAGLIEPLFENKRGVFKVTLFNDADDNYDSKRKRLPKTADNILEFCRTPRTREELKKYTGYSRYYTMSRIIQPLLNDGRLKMTVPNKPKSLYQKYIKA